MGNDYLLFHVTGKARTQLIECHQRTLLFQSGALLLVNKCSLAAQDSCLTSLSAQGEREQLFSFKKFLFIYWFFVAARLFSSCAAWVSIASPVAEHGLQGMWTSVAADPGL